MAGKTITGTNGKQYTLNETTKKWEQVGSTNTGNASKTLSGQTSNWNAEKYAEKQALNQQAKDKGFVDEKAYTNYLVNDKYKGYTGPTGGGGGNDETATDTELGNAIASWYASMQAKNNEYYDKAQKASDLNYNKIRRAYLAQNARSKRQLKGEYAKIGQNPSHSTGWDMDYATSKNLADLDISRAQDDASIAKGRYDANNTLVSNVLGSGLSNSALLKALKGII